MSLIHAGLYEQDGQSEHGDVMLAKQCFFSLGYFLPMCWNASAHLFSCRCWSVDTHTGLYCSRWKWWVWLEKGVDILTSPWAVCVCVRTCVYRCFQPVCHIFVWGLAGMRTSLSTRQLLNQASQVAACCWFIAQLCQSFRMTQFLDRFWISLPRPLPWVYRHSVYFHCARWYQSCHGNNEHFHCNVLLEISTLFSLACHTGYN